MLQDVVKHAQALPTSALRSNIEINLARQLPLVQFGQQEHGAISVCGNGPSLRTIYPQHTQEIAALNGAWRALAKQGITPDYIIAYDPAPENVAWFEGAPDTTYLLGSRMDPKVFDLLKGKKVYIWHTLSAEEQSLGLSPLIGGGATVGGAAINLLAAMWYRHFDCYGYDSCWANDGSHHATPQEWAIEPPKVYNVDDRPFLTSPWMIGQVQEMLKQVFYNRCDYSIKVHGDGLLAACLDHNTLETYYDLDVAPGSFDFIYSLLNTYCYMHEQGYSKLKVHFKAGSDQGFRPNEPIFISHDQKSRMMNKVVRPLLAMFGAEEVDSVKDDAMFFHYSPRYALEYYRSTKFLPEFKPKWPARLYMEQTYGRRQVVTITLRKCSYWPQRNSDEGAWIKFAGWLKAQGHTVVFVRDTDSLNDPWPHKFECCNWASTDLHMRAALYRVAKMNFFVTNGPASLAWMTRTTPYVNFYKDAPGYWCHDPQWLQTFIGIDPYGQFPWANLQGQRLLWKNDTFENMVEAATEFGL